MGCKGVHVATYKYDHVQSRHLLRRLFVVLGISAFVLAAIAAVFLWTMDKRQATVVGQTTEVPQATTKQAYTQINEPFFTMQLPSDWKQTSSQDTATVHSISWQDMDPKADNRYLTIYIDTIPATYPVNRELPLTAHGSQLTYGALSDNCDDFTPGGTTNVAQADELKPAPSVWQGVNFICNLPQFIDNQVGTGSTTGINSVTITGPTSGAHNYFFLYIDRNAEPDYTILYNLIQSFRAK